MARAFAVLGLLSCAGLWAATEAPPRGSVVVWSGDDQWVKIERQDDAAAPNDHPVTLGADSVANALAALRVRPSDSGDAETDRPAFAKEELARLAPQIAEGLSRAGPRQDVTFSTIGSHSFAAYSMLKDPGVNTGRVFYADGKLNVIFGELQANYRKKNVYGRRDQDFEPRRVGSRSQLSPQKWLLATAPGIEMHTAEGGTVRTDWVTIDPRIVGSQPPASAAATAPAAAEKPPAPVPAGAAPAAAAAPAASSAAPARAESSAAKPSTSDLEQRLKVLKDLKDKGLITEQAYEEKVQALLSEL